MCPTYLRFYYEQPYPVSTWVSLFWPLFPRSLPWTRPESPQNIFCTAAHVFTPWGSTNIPYQCLSLNWPGHWNSQVTWGLWRAFRQKLFSTCNSHLAKWLSLGDTPSTPSAVCDWHCHRRVLGLEEGWGGGGREHAYTEPMERIGYS